MLCEQLILQRYSLGIVDPEGDYTCLEALPAVILQRMDGSEASFIGMEQALAHPDLSLVVDLSAAPREEKPALARRLLETLNRLRRATGLPHRVVIDEAHYFLNRLDAPVLFDRELGGYLRFHPEGPSDWKARSDDSRSARSAASPPGRCGAGPSRARRLSPLDRRRLWRP